MANLVLASKRELKSGMFWHVYRSENNNKSEEFYFANPLKALVLLRQPPQGVALRLHPPQAL